MRHQLDNAGRIVLADDLASSCIITGEHLSGGDIHFRIWLHSEEWDAPVFADISAERVQDCISRLRSGGEFDHWARLTESGGRGIECPICLEDRYTAGEQHVMTEVCQHPGRELRAVDSSPFLHAGCVDDFCDVLESVFDQYPKVMLEFV
ncbi:hypothetical protein [Halostella salina]|uniref:hypothetical protein n=1 Tax=Halostella salina TaxID=1547897 RepID=UPI0013CEE6F0|nr:hypothetical protein [Halostella salina]